ncbi:MAG: Ppx/GppA family phosphatase [Segniliparus sp.]|uniref:Ppx/GppA phosphatase family protein n=1 Tax=Segniliparus sp. TaxID=2804064 RepID=UPI003F40E71B
MPEARILAAVDCGTNSLRLLIGEAGNGGVRAVRRETRIVGLGTGVDTTGRIAPEPMARAIAVLEDYAQLMRDAGVVEAAMVATSASRDAVNAEEFLGRARDVLGAAVAAPDVRVISGQEEAALSFAGATGGFSSEASAAPGPYVVVDVGGGSTEFAVGSETGVDATVSLDMGCVRLTERFVRSDPPAAAEIDRIRSYVKSFLEETEIAGLPEARTAVAVAGTALTVAAVALGHTALEPGPLSRERVPVSQLVTTAGLLSSMTLAERTALGPMDAGRAPVIPCGAWILAEVGLYLQERAGVTEFLVREEDILDGVLLQIAAGTGG